MDSIPQKVDEYVKLSIDHSVGLHLPSDVLQLKIRSLEAAHYRLRNQYLNLQMKLKEKDDAVELARAESCMNAQALKKFVEENQKLATECASLVGQCSRLERECALYDRDREALMEFGNEADERAKEAEARVQELEEMLKRVSEEATFYKSECDALSADSSVGGTSVEQTLLEGLVASLVNKDEISKTVHAFLEANSEVEPCQKLLKMWSSLTPATLNGLWLAAQLRLLQKDKEHLRVNLHRAEEEVKLLYEDNSLLDEENKRLLNLYNSQRKHLASGGKHSSSSTTKSNKRKSSSQQLGSPVERKIDFSDMESPRRPLSPLKENSPDPRTFKM